MSGYGKAYDEAYALQRVLLRDVESADTTPGKRALIAKTFLGLENLRIRIRTPHLKAQREARKRAPKVTRNGRRGPVAPESLAPVIASTTSPVIADATSQASSSSTVVEPQPAASTSPAPSTAPTTAPVPAAAAPQDEPSI